MKKIFVLLFMLLILTSCSKDEEIKHEQSDLTAPQQDMVINVTDAALAKMNFELKNSKIEGEIYRVDFGYSSAG